MPIYEYQCTACRHDFELLIHAGATPVCPACESPSIEKRLSAFAVGRGGSPPAPAVAHACGTCGDPRGAGACSMD